MHYMETYIVHGESVQNFITAVYPMRFANSLINDFESNEYDPNIPSCLFNDFESRPIVLIHIPFCNEKGKVSKQL